MPQAELSDADLWGSAAPTAPANAPAPAPGAPPPQATSAPATPVQLAPGDAPPPAGTPYLTPGGQVLWNNATPTDTTASVVGQGSGPPGGGGAALSDKDLWGDQKPAPAAPGPSLAGDVGQFARGAFQTLEGAGDQIANIASGAPAFMLRTASGASDQIADLLRGALGNGPPPRHIDLTNPAAVASTALSQPATPFLNPGRAQVDQWAATPPANLQEGASRVAGMGVVGALAPGEEPMALMPFLRNAALGAAGGAAAQGAGSLPIPEALKPEAETVGGLVGALAAHGAGKVAEVATRPILPFAALASKGAAEFQAGGRLARAGVTTDQAALPTGGDPTAVAKFFTGQLAQIDAQHAAAVEAAHTAAQPSMAALGGEGTPEGYGATIRSAVQNADAARHQAASQLYQVFDPDGTATGNVTPIKAAAQSVRSAMMPTSAPMTAEEAAAFKAAANMPDVAPLKMVTELRSHVGDLQANATGPAKARLSQLYGAIEDNLSSTIADKVQSERAQVAAGQLAPEQTIEAREQAVRSQWGLPARTVARTGNGASTTSYAAGGGQPPTVPGVGGTAGQASGGPGNGPGYPGLPSEPGQPTVTPEQLGSLKTAQAAWKQYKQDFASQPVSTALDTRGPGVPATPDSTLGSRFFHGGTKAYGDTSALLKVAPEAAEPLSNYAAMTLRRETMTPDGTIDPVKFARWQAKYRDAVRALPEAVQSRFADAGAAGQTIADAAQARVQAIHDAQLGAVGKVMGLSEPQDVTHTIGGILGGKTAVADMRTLATRARADPEAFEGLRQAVADHVSAQATSGDALKSYLKANRGALGQVFGPSELAGFDSLANALGSGGHGGTASHMGAGGMGMMLGVLLGEHLHLPEIVTGPIGGAVGGFAEALRNQGVSRVDQLVREAFTNTPLRNRLLAKVPANKPSAVQSAMRGVISALGASNGLRPPTIYASPASP